MQYKNSTKNGLIASKAMLSLVLIHAFLTACNGGNQTSNDTKPLEITFVGVSTILISDGTTQLLSDGFFTRPSFASLASVQPDITIIDEQLESLGIDELAAVMVVHSHYDHAMDAPYVASATNAVLMGSNSTANIARGWGLHDGQILEVETGRSYRYGDFSVSFIPSRHYQGVPSDPNAMSIDEPLIPPVNALDYKEGDTYSIHISHPSSSILIHASVNYEPDALTPYDAELVLLGINGLGASDAEFQEQYYLEVVEAVDANKIVPIHWDNFFLPLANPLRPLSGFDESMSYLNQRVAQDEQIEVIVLDYGESIVLP